MNLSALQAFQIQPKDHDYKASDAILYALGLGYGADPTDEAQVAFVFEHGLKTVPSLCNTLAHPGFWINDPALDIDWVKALHAEQSFVIHKPLPAKARVRGAYRIVGLEDKGAYKGAILTLEKTLTDRDTGEVYCTVNQAIFLRGDGGHGGFGSPLQAPSALPEGAPDLIIDTPTIPQLALIYRLSGDLNPLHASPAVARKAGFPQPILQGLCTMGLATRALLEGVCDQDPERLKSLFVRFSKPVFPGETIRTEIYRQEDRLRFRCRSVERDLIVLDRGEATLTA